MTFEEKSYLRSTIAEDRLNGFALLLYVHRNIEGFGWINNEVINLILMIWGININYVFVVVIAGDILAMISDTPSTWTSPVLPKLLSNDTNENPLGEAITADQQTWIGSLMNIGAILGALPFGFLADSIGRKPVLLILAIPHLSAFLIFAFAKNIYLFYIGRILNGISYTGSYIVMPMYIAEISEDSYRGTLLVSYALSACAGDLLSYVLGPYVSIMIFNLVLAVFPLLFLLVFGFVAPESPHYLVERNEKKASDSLAMLRSTKSVETELEGIKKEKIKNVKGDIFNTLKKRYVIKAFFVSLCLFSFLQLSGLSPILWYTQLIFDDSGVNVASDVSSIIVGCVLFLATLTSISFVDRKGRKPLLLLSAGGMMISLSLLGAYLFIRDKDVTTVEHLRWVPLPCLMMYVCTFCMGFGPLCLTVSSEIMPSNVKFLLITIVYCFSSLISFMLTKFFIDMNDAITTAGTFWFYAGCCCLALFFVYFIVPETYYLYLIVLGSTP